MSQTPEEQPEQPAMPVERAEALISRMEQSIGAFPSRVGQRFQQATTRLREQGKQRKEQPGQQGGVQDTESNQPAMEKADQVVGNMEQRMKHITARTNLQTRKITARLRENAEDFWAEVQHVRHG